MVVFASGVGAAAAKILQKEVFGLEEDTGKKKELSVPGSSDLFFQGWYLGSILFGLKELVPGCAHDLSFHGVLGKLFLFPLMLGRGEGSQERVDVYLSFGLCGNLSAMAPGSLSY